MPLMHSGDVTPNAWQNEPCVWPSGTWQEILATARSRLLQLLFPWCRARAVEWNDETWGQNLSDASTWKEELPLCKQQAMKCIFPLLKAALNHAPAPVTVLRLVLLSVKTSNGNKTWEKLPHLGLLQQQLAIHRLLFGPEIKILAPLALEIPLSDTDTAWSLLECWAFEETL